MRLLADENVPAHLVEALRTAGHDVLWMRAEAPGTPDEDVLEEATGTGRLLLTFDKDFGDLVFRVRLPAEPGVVLLRLRGLSEAEVQQIVTQALTSRRDWAGHFAVVDRDRVRLTPLPDL